MISQNLGPPHFKTTTLYQSESPNFHCFHPSASMFYLKPSPARHPPDILKCKFPSPHLVHIIICPFFSNRSLFCLIYSYPASHNIFNFPYSPNMENHTFGLTKWLKNQGLPEFCRAFETYMAIYVSLAREGTWTWYSSSVISILFYFYWLHQIFCNGFMFSFCTAYSVNCLESFEICRPYVMYSNKLSNKRLRGYGTLVKKIPSLVSYLLLYTCS